MNFTDNSACFLMNYQGVRLDAVIVCIVRKIQLLYVLRLYETGRSLVLVQDTSLWIEDLFLRERWFHGRHTHTHGNGDY